MATTEQMVAAMRLITEANRLYDRLWSESVNTTDDARRERLYGIRRKAIQRMDRRCNAYYMLVYGEVSP